MKIYIKNMACLSCKVFVKEALEDLKIEPVKIELGEIETPIALPMPGRIIMSERPMYAINKFDIMILFLG